MNFYIQQSIEIQTIKINSMANSSIFQIGSSGQIKADSHLYNTGGFNELAPEPEKPSLEHHFIPPFAEPIIPLAPPSHENDFSGDPNES